MRYFAELHSTGWQVTLNNSDDVFHGCHPQFFLQFERAETLEMQLAQHVAALQVFIVIRPSWCVGRSFPLTRCGRPTQLPGLIGASAAAHNEPTSPHPARITVDGRHFPAPIRCEVPDMAKVPNCSVPT